MHGPPLAGWLLVALSAAVGAYCLLRVRTAPPAQRRAAAGDALMGLGMAAMAVPASALDTGRWGGLALAAVFGAAAVRAVLPLRHAAGHLHHLIGALAMVYMGLAMAATGGHAGHGAPAGLPLVTGVLLAYYLLYVLRGGGRLVVAGGGRATGGTAWTQRPELVAGCRVSMGIGMFAMLLTM
ncbi:DUF5134 domain-containing protein [Streptomyces sp. A7024]|uniref:DUF5134 domain-containing protein n=1 Tax=Streptomyces coryli TaxID=1128680 RepID=A0A6G4TZL2_9ACTN|nr:DUF5134 domain-containing protein [Streptomyces coryli]NGN64467.1 DUF5134 domain-containing protein [Streptomyces coryli]